MNWKGADNLELSKINFSKSVKLMENLVVTWYPTRKYKKIEIYFKRTGLKSRRKRFLSSENLRFFFLIIFLFRKQINEKRIHRKNQFILGECHSWRKLGNFVRKRTGSGVFFLKLGFAFQIEVISYFSSQWFVPQRK